MFGAYLTAVVSLCHLYVFWRIASLTYFRRRLYKGCLIAFGLFLWLLFIGGRLYGQTHENTFSYWLELGGMNWMGTLFLLTSSQLAVEILSGGGYFFPRLTLKLRGLAFVVGLLLSGIALIQGTSAPVVDSYEVNLPSLPATLDGTVMAVMSDLHLGTLLREKWFADRIAQVREIHPDLVLLVGDIFESHGEKSRHQASRLLLTMNAPLGVWGVPGNHEFYGGPQTIKSLEEGGVKLLRNSWIQVKPGLILAGVEENNFSRRPEDGQGLITKALAGRPTGATILLSHKPWLAEEAAGEGVELMLSGHTHGGQIWPFNYLVAYFFPLLAGRYTIERMPILVCRGTGTWGARMRLWQPGEIMKVTLRSGR